MSPDQKKAGIWNNPEMLKMVEEGRYPYQRAISRIVSNTFRNHIEPNTVILEVGAGLGYLKDLVPAEYHARYITSDYSGGNLAAGAKKRQIQAVAGSAFDLPLANCSVGCVVDMDAYDTLLGLDRALAEAKRVLTPGGVYIHFQVNFPSDDTVWDDHPNYVFFPATVEQGYKRGPMVGMQKEDFIKGLTFLHNPPIKRFMSRFLTDHTGATIDVVNHTNSIEASRMVQTALDVMPFDRMVIPSVPHYFQDKLERAAREVGLSVRYSQFDGTVARGLRSKVQSQWPQSNEFSMEQGTVLHTRNEELAVSGSKDVIEKASLLVFIAQKSSKELFKPFLTEDFLSKMIKLNPKA